MKKIYRRRIEREAEKSSFVPLDLAADVTVLYDDINELQQIKKVFPNVNGITSIESKRKKDVQPDANQLYRNDFNWKGIPKFLVEDQNSDHSMIINISSHQKLFWYWYARKYALRVDLRGTYDNSDFTVAGTHNLAVKLETLVNFLKMINHD